MVPGSSPGARRGRSLMVGRWFPKLKARVRFLPSSSSSRLVVRTTLFHGVNTGSIPVRSVAGVAELAYAPVSKTGPFIG